MLPVAITSDGNAPTSRAMAGESDSASECHFSQPRTPPSAHSERRFSTAAREAWLSGPRLLPSR